MLHYVHRRLVFLTSGEVWADPALRTSTATTSLPEGRRTHHSHRSPFRYVLFSFPPSSTFTEMHLSIARFFLFGGETCKARLRVACLQPPDLTRRCCLPLTAVPLSAAARLAHPQPPFPPPAAYSRDHRRHNRTHFITADILHRPKNTKSKKTFSFPFNLPLVIHALQPLTQSRLPNVSQRNTVSIWEELLCL